MTKRLIKKLIESYVDDAFKQTDVFLEADDDLDLDPGADAAGGEEELDLDAGGGLDDAAGGGLGGAGDGGDGGLDLGSDGEEGDLEGEDDLGDDMGGDFGGGGGGGFGGGGGMGGGDESFGDEEMGDDPEAEEGDDLPQKVDLPDDPIQAATDIAIKMLEKTGDDSVILGAVKASIQANFDDFVDAQPIIKSLWDTEHPTLRVVARKLLLFIQGR